MFLSLSNHVLLNILKKNRTILIHVMGKRSYTWNIQKGIELKQKHSSLWKIHNHLINNNFISTSKVNRHVPIFMKLYSIPSNYLLFFAFWSTHMSAKGANIPNSTSPSSPPECPTIQHILHYYRHSLCIPHKFRTVHITDCYCYAE